jgi:hypothetical protein
MTVTIGSAEILHQWPEEGNILRSIGEPRAGNQRRLNFLILYRSVSRVIPSITAARV